MVAGMAGDLIAGQTLSSDVVATATGTLTISDGDAVIAIVISMMTAGVVAATGEASPWSAVPWHRFGLALEAVVKAVPRHRTPKRLGEAFLTPSERIRIMTYPTSCGCGGTGRRAGLRSL